MDSKPESFESLRRLLTLKRYECPPPGYFDDFAQQVLIGIQHRPESAPTTAERLGWELPWLQRFLEILTAKPALAGAVGVITCGAMVVGILQAERLDSLTVVNDAEIQPALALPAGEAAMVFNQPLEHPALVADTNALAQPSLIPPEELFGRNLPYRQVKFPFPSP